jgi:hypothetical protein
MQEETAVVLQAADAVLERKEKLDSAIQNGVSELQGLIAARLETEHAFRRLEAAAAINAPAPGLEKARTAAADARAALEQAGLRLGGYRMALGEMGADFVSRYDGVARVLSQHNAAVAQAFEAEWQSALTTWCLWLGRRRAIEAALGQSLDLLPEPNPAAVQISADVARPAQTLVALTAAIKAIGSGKKLSERPVAPGYNPAAVYRVTSDRMAHMGIMKGAFVVDATFRPGELARLVETENARPVQDRDTVAGITIAANKADAIARAARDKELAESERRLHGNTGEQTTRRYDLEKELTPPDDSAERERSNSEVAAASGAFNLGPGQLVAVRP